MILLSASSATTSGTPANGMPIGAEDPDIAFCDQRIARIGRIELALEISRDFEAAAGLPKHREVDRGGRLGVASDQPRLGIVPCGGDQQCRRRRAGQADARLGCCKCIIFASPYAMGFQILPGKRR
jgi:hypothetical protein